MTFRIHYSIAAIFLVCVLLACHGVHNPDLQENGTKPIVSSKFLFVGNYTKMEGHVHGKAEGIQVYRLSEDEYPELLFTSKEAINPSYITVSADGRFLYAVNETGPDVGDEAKIAAYEINDSTGVLTLLNEQSSHSFAPCYISVDSQNRLVFVVNYVGGVVAVYPINADGSLAGASQVIRLEGQGPHQRQDASHPHSIILSPDEEFAFVADLGTDKIMVYKIDYLQAELIEASVPFVKLEVPPDSGHLGMGPRHLVFHPDGLHLYAVNELSNTISVFQYQAENGNLIAQQSTSTLPLSFSGANVCAAIHISEDGKFLYASNRGHDSVVIYSIDPQTGSLEHIGHEPSRGKFPRNFLIDGQDLYVANQNTDNVVLFKIGEDGALTYKSEYAMKTPVCLKVFDYRTIDAQR
ncbi:MAG: lactonase family protein [Bacteroidetes bacterium]|nr:lactonase family protein [Bacteroidota bacterium]